MILKKYLLDLRKLKPKELEKKLKPKEFERKN
jgi:hypothetical protein